MSNWPGLHTLLRFGLAAAGGIIRLFAAGAVLFEAHQLFLRYYAREWGGIQFSGVNGCAGEDGIANGDLFEGQTFCNQPINFVPWVELYRRHWLVAVGYYAAIVAVLVLIGWLMHLGQRRLAGANPYGSSPTAPAPAESEHLR